MNVYGYLVVGSGCSGAMAAQTLVDAGVKVTMIDTGIQKAEQATIPDKDFLTLRKTDDEQYRYLIGDQASGVSWGKVGKGEQITPPRKHILQDVDKYIPVVSKNFSPLESLGYGGLGIGWGLQCWEYSPADMEAAGLDTARMRNAYQVIGDRIGISATKDDAARYTLGSLKTKHRSPAMDRNHTRIFNMYTAKKSSLNRRGFFLGRTPLALITKDMGKRKKYAYRDMDFYSDNDESAWRPWMTIDQLKKKSNFTYIGGYLAIEFHETKNYTDLTCINLQTQVKETFRCKKLILATSALGSGRLVLRSLGKTGDRLPLLCNPYSYVPCVQPRLLGKAAEARKLGFTQLSLFFDKNKTNQNTSVASIYGYQSLMLFRIIRHVPLNFADARILMQYLLSSIVIMGVHHADNPSNKKFIQLVKKPGATGDALKINYELKDSEIATHKEREKQFLKAMRKMGTFGLKRVDPGHGASIHYAGTLPFSHEDKPFTLSPNGRLHGTKSVYVADSSGFRFLPAPGLTFSLMANAHNVAESVLHNES